MDLLDQKIYFRGAGLSTTVGHSIAATLSFLEKNQPKPNQLVIKMGDEDIDIPYFSIKHREPSNQEYYYQVIDSVVQDAIDAAELSAGELEKAGLFLGSTSFDMNICEQSIKANGESDDNIDKCIPPFTRLTSYIKDTFSIHGPAFTFNTACTSSANALIYAAQLIRQGEISHAIVVGLEFYNDLTVMGFSSLELISKKGMKPFNQARDGLYLGEGCGAIVISEKPLENDPNPFYYHAGSNLGGNFSISASDPVGSTISTLVKKTLKKANITPQDISIIKVHGTASLSNDNAESNGLGKAFPIKIPPIVALKPLIGHTLGACGINELILFYKSLQARKIISYCGDISTEFPLDLAKPTDIPQSGYYLLNYFGFGDNNTSIIISNV